MEDIKTTIIGLSLAILMSVQAVVSDDFDIKKDWLKLAVAAFIGALGWVASDSKKNQNG